jgi:hypothetical protein
MFFRGARQLSNAGGSPAVVPRGSRFVTLTRIAIRAVSTNHLDEERPPARQTYGGKLTHDGRYYNDNLNTNHRTRRKLEGVRRTHAINSNPKYRRAPTTFENSNNRSAHQVIDCIINDLGTFLPSRQATQDVEYAMRTATPEQLKAIGATLVGKMFEVFLWTPGAVIIQKVLPALPEDERHSLVRELWADMKRHEAAHVVEYVGYDEYEQEGLNDNDNDNQYNIVVDYAKGSHNCLILQSLLKHGDEEIRKAVASAAAGHAMELAMDDYGVFVVQALMNFLPKHLRNAFVAELLSDPAMVVEAALDRRANFPLQIVMEKGSESEAETIGQAFKGHMLVLANDQFGQFCAIKALRVLRKSTRDPLAAELLADPEQVLNCASDSSGTFVMQEIIEHGTFDEKKKIGQALRSHMTEVSVV